MGCALSKLHNEDTVRRCKERRRLMAQAVYARHHLAAAHSDYCRSLRRTGASLSAFAAGEPSCPLEKPTPVLTRTHSSISHSYSLPNIRRRPPPSQPISRSASFNPPASSSSRRHHRPMKLPHILSESSPSFSPNSHISSPVAKNAIRRPPQDAFLNSSVSRTSSQVSSMFNWENLRPPSPPNSEYFQNLSGNYSVHHYPPDPHFDRQSDLRNSPGLNPFRQQGNSDIVEEWEEEERVEVPCSEWDDHLCRSSTSTTSSGNEDVEGDDESRSDTGTRSDFGSSVPNGSEYRSCTPKGSEYRPMAKSEKSYSGGSSARRKPAGDGGGGGSAARSQPMTSEMSIVASHKDLKEIVDAIRDQFDKAADAGGKMSDVLEIGRAQFDRSFTQLRKTLYHSSNVLSNLSSSWMSKPPLRVKYRLDAASLLESGETKGLCSTLERLLTWEKILYKEVKAREGAKIENEKKLATLQNQEYRRVDETKLDKTKASIQRLQSEIIVKSQAVSTTSNAINQLKDTYLVRQLIEFCHALMYSWKSMNESHEQQALIAQQVQGLVNRSAEGQVTSDAQRQVTRDLESALSAWRSSFTRLMNYQKDFIHSLHGWMKLTFIPVHPTDYAKATGEPAEVIAFFEEWKLAFYSSPDTVAAEAVKSFVNIIHAIQFKQTEELKIKKQAQAVSKEYEKRALSVRNLEMKYYQSFSVVGLEDGHHGGDDPLFEKKSELEAYRKRVEGEVRRHLKAAEETRAVTLNHVQLGLPGVFRAMENFSASLVDAMEKVCYKSYDIQLGQGQV